MARSEGVPVIKLHVDKEKVIGGNSIEHYLKALVEAMKTKPKSVERTITYYPEAVELTVKYDDKWKKRAVFVREN